MYEAGQIKGSIAMSHPDRLHSHGQRGDLCYGSPSSNRGAEHLLEMVRLNLLRFSRQTVEVARRGVLNFVMFVDLKAVHWALAMHHLKLLLRAVLSNAPSASVDVTSAHKTSLRTAHLCTVTPVVPAWLSSDDVASPCPND